jgi:hypothetical protein
MFKSAKITPISVRFIVQRRQIGKKGETILNQRLPAKLTRSIAVLAVAFMLAFSPGAGSNVHAQGQAGIKLTARAGFAGFCKQERWLPVQVQVENTGEDLTDARILVRYKYNGSETTYAADLALPNSSRKAVTLYAKAADAVRQVLTVSLVSGDKTLATTNVNMSCLGAEIQVIGVAADNPAALDDLGGLNLVSGQTRRAELNLSDLPERVEGWDTLDVLVVLGVDTGTLSQGQRQALTEWLMRGGRLLAVGGPKWQAMSAGLDELLPVQVGSTKKIQDLSALTEYARSENILEGETTLSVGSVRAGASVLVEQDGIPLIVERQIGFGRVIYLAADPTIQPLSEWNGLETLYKLLLGPRPAPPRWSRVNVWDIYEAGQALSILSEVEVPSVLYLLCWLGGYIALIGPINYLILKRIKRNQLAWISVPILAVAFTVIAYVTGGIFRGSGPVLNRLAVVQAWDGQEQAQVQALVGLYSPNRATYTLQTENLLAGSFDPSGSSDTGGDWLDIQNGTASQIPEIRVESGGMKSFTMVGSTPALSITHDLEIQISGGNPQLTGRITNNSQYALKNAVLVMPGYHRRLGDILPGKSVDVDMTLVNGSSGTLLGTTASSILNVPEYPEESVTARQVRFLNSVLTTGYYYQSPADPNWGIHLMGWLDKSVLDVELAGKRAEMIDTTLYVTSLTPAIKFSNGAWKLTPAMFAWEGSTSIVSPYGDMDLSTGGYSLYFKPAFPLHYRSVESLNLYVNTANTTNAPHCSIWDYVDNQWHELENVTLKSYDIPEAWRYVGPNGELLLNVDGNSGYIEVTDSHFTLVVKP